ncbi:MAG: NAD+ synthase [Desulfobulbaceae bacterium]|nr:NAD+ synthase [Desulfobulbaceae bacterium]
MKIALIQTNPVIGDFARNSDAVLRWTAAARAAGCRLAVFPELTLSGYPPQDLLERSDFINAHDRHLLSMVEKITDIAIVIGAIEQRSGSGKPLYNSALFIDDGKVKACARKQLLPTYDVFDETRYFEPGGESAVVCLDGERFGLTVCEDIWFEGRGYRIDPVRNMLAAETGKPDFLINISASPYHHGKISERNAVFSSLCRRNRLPLLYVNQVGGQDSLIFDGRSMALDPDGGIVAAAPGFQEAMIIVDSNNWQPAPGLDLPEDSIATVFEALTLGVRDYLHKTGFKTAVIGLSGGIDSALTAAVACRALGPENVLTVSLPSPYTSQASIDDAQALAANLNCGHETISIGPAMDAYQKTLSPFFQGLAEDVTEQNIQARIRGNLLMALSNKFGHLLLSTGNKSEMAVGYCTLYGDMSGGLAVLSDVPKQMVYELARWLNSKEEIIPERIITRPPSAELKPDQLDQDDLPPYEILDPILQAYLEEHASIDVICARGYERKTVEDIVRRIRVNEYKRRQAATGLKVTTKAFGQGRRYPIVHNFRE